MDIEKFAMIANDIECSMYPKYLSRLELLATIICDQQVMHLERLLDMGDSTNIDIEHYPAMKQSLEQSTNVELCDTFKVGRGVFILD